MMRRVLCLLAVLAMCLMLTVSVYADSFVPSISYKVSPEVLEVELDGEDGTNCIVITSLKEAEEKSTDIYQEDRDLLYEVYEKLSDGSMKLPLDSEDYAIRELVDISFTKTGCVEAAHGHKEWLAQENTTVKIVVDLGINKNEKLKVFAYVNGEWAKVESVVNNNGTVTCVFDDICPVAFCIEEKAEANPPKTGDVAGNMTGWAVLMVVSFAAVVLLYVNRRRIVR